MLSIICGAWLATIGVSCALLYIFVAGLFFWLYVKLFWKVMIGLTLLAFIGLLF